MEMVHFIPSSQRKFALLAAQADSAPVLIYGASGTGKGAIGHWIHANGPRAARIFHIASQTKPLAGQIIEAQGGTLMIPELGEWNLSEQKTLLNYLKTKSIARLSQDKDVASMPVIANVRIIGTTSQSLEGRAQGGLFNIELLEKLNVFRLEMPPLIKRKNEFEDIVMGLLGEISRELHKDYLRHLSPESWKLLKVYEWPGNLRELRNVIQLAAMAAQGDQIEISDFPDFGCTKIDFHATREQFEKVYILELLKSFEGEIDKVCLVTRIDKNILLSKIQHYGIPLDQSRQIS